MIYWCQNCYYSPDCATKWKQCIDYTYATEEQIKKNAKFIKDTISSVIDWSFYDKVDAITRQLLKKFDKRK